jgi:Reverse transcriptase (RNA-dependent DNA polymerase)
LHLTVQLCYLPVSLRLRDPSVRTYHGGAFAVPKIHEKVIKDEVDRLVTLQVLHKTNSSEWAAPSFGIPKKNNQIRFISDFRQLNKNLTRLPFPLPNPQQLFCTMDGFSFCTTMDLNMDFWAIKLDAFSQQLCTIILPWGKYSSLRLPMGLSCYPDIYQEKMSTIFADLETVIVSIDDICIISKGSFHDHLKFLSEVLQRLLHNNLKVHANNQNFAVLTQNS